MNQQQQEYASFIIHLGCLLIFGIICYLSSSFNQTERKKKLKRKKKMRAGQSAGRMTREWPQWCSARGVHPYPIYQGKEKEKK